MKENKSKDFGLASFLLAQNCEMVGYTTDTLGQLFFEFAPDERIAELERGFYSNTIAVQPQDYLAAQIMLKAIIFETKRNTYENRIGRFSKNTTQTIS